MQPFDEDGGEDGDIVFRDLIMLMLSGFVTVAVLLLPHIGESRAKAATETVQPPDNVLIEARWPDRMDTDVDLWVQAPGDVPVGYSNKGGAIFNLLRDDLGERADALGSITRSAMPAACRPASTRPTCISTATRPAGGYR
jgi:hypothetical protein